MRYWGDGVVQRRSNGAESAGKLGRDTQVRSSPSPSSEGREGWGEAGCLAHESGYLPAPNIHRQPCGSVLFQMSLPVLPSIVDSGKKR